VSAPAPTGGTAAGAEERSRERVVWLAALVLAAAQAALLMRGYRITADDVLFFDAALRGFGAARDLTWSLAEGQGRIGAFIIIPINIVSAWLADWAAFRLLGIGLYFLVFLLFGIWFQRLSGQRIATLLFLLMVAFNVTDYLHLPPIAFPLQNTIPFLAILAGRLHLMRQEHGTALTRAAALAAFGFGMVATEYGFLLGTALLACEWFQSALRSGSLAAAVRHLGDRAIWPGLLVTLIVLALYVGWRLAFPSKYDGNQLAPLSRLPHGLVTALAHMFSNYALPYVSVLRPLPYPGSGWALVALGYGAVAGAGFMAARRTMAELRHPLVLACAAFLAGLYAVLPASLTLKQQIACFESFGCAFLDSQIAYLATTIVGAALCGWLIAIPATDLGRVRLATLLACLAALGAAGSFYHDRRMTDDMAQIAGIWRAAEAKACREDLPSEGLSQVFDPGPMLGLHPGFDREGFWRAYVAARRPHCR